MTERLDGEWIVHERIRTVYEHWWCSLHLDLVERPDGTTLEHEVLEARPAAGTVVYDPEQGFLLIWRHRFMPDTWGWELPAGCVDEGEEPQAAAARECLEETGWRPGPLRHVASYQPSSGLCSQVFHLFAADGATHEGPPEDVNEAAKIAWRSPEQVASDLHSGDIKDGLAQYGLAMALALQGRSELLAGGGFGSP